MDTLRAKYTENIKLYDKIILILLFSVSLYLIAGIYNNQFMKLMSVADYLTWHMIFEFASILVSFSIFTVSYFVFEESKRLSLIVLGCSFLLMGALDTLHTFSFKGMADFFIANSSANRATTLWILSRTLGSLGFLAAVLIPGSLKSSIRKGLFFAVTIIFTIALFLLVTYFPTVFPPMLIEESGLTTTKIVMEYVIISIMLYTLAIVLSEYNKTQHVREQQFIIALIFMIFSEFAFTSYGSVYDAFNYIGHIFKIVASIVLYKAIYIDNISEPYREVKKARNELREYSENLNLLVKQRTKDLEEANSALLKDIEYAKEMQLRLMPSNMPEDLSVKFIAEYLPAERLSGDFYNVTKLDEENIALYIGDVSGHGVSAAMLTIFAKQSIVPLKKDEYGLNQIISPALVLDSIYKDFNNTNFKDETYILMLYGLYNRKTKTLTYASAGMNASPYIIKNSGEVLELNSRGFSICKLGEYMVPTYENRVVQMESGDKIMFYSDGLVEAKNANNKVYGQEKLKNFILNNYMANSKDLKYGLKKDLFMHIGNAERLTDDVTLLIMEVN